MFPMKFSSDSLQICYIDSFLLICWCLQADIFDNFLIFRCLSTVFTYKNMAWENVKVSD